MLMWSFVELQLQMAFSTQKVRELVFFQKTSLKLVSFKKD
jgi:hypothetical protein